jgi:hypothetical protein
MGLVAAACAAPPAESTGASEAADTSGQMAFYHSDSCTGELQAFVGEHTNCAELSSHVPGTVWGIKINGTCVDIADQSFVSACRAFQASSRPHTTVLHHSDTCGNGSALAYVDEQTDCEAIDVGNTVWGISRDGVCTDTVDLPFVTACNQFKGASGSKSDVKLFRSNRCSGESVATLGAGTNCRSLSGLTQSISAIGVDGRCIDIADTSVLAACQGFRAAGDPSATALYSSDSCREGSAVAYVNDATACSATSITSEVRAIRQDGACINVSDMTFANACSVFQGSSHGGSERSFFHSDQCSSQLVSTATGATDCARLGAIGSQSVWGMKSGERCYDIQDTTYLDACYAYAAGDGPDVVELYRSDTCSGALQAFVGPRTDCSALASHVSGTVWGVRINGECQDITDSDFASACARFKPSL